MRNNRDCFFFSLSVSLPISVLRVYYKPARYGEFIPLAWKRDAPGRGRTGIKRGCNCDQKRVSRHQKGVYQDHSWVYRERGPFFFFLISSSTHHLIPPPPPLIPVTPIPGDRCSPNKPRLINSKTRSRRNGQTGKKRFLIAISIAR